ncbi:MAG: M48 family metallopeptidase [Betaproteobacteria bacterium]|nr:M48 family metallopeptidase [Betaproteobacteria bacterium]
MGNRLFIGRCGLPLLVLWTLMLPACQTVQTTRAGAVGVERKQAMLLSVDQVNRGADQAYRQTIAEAAKKGTLNRNSAQVSRVRAAARRLIDVTGAFRGDAPGWRWEVNVITSPDVNAWCMPGGKVAVYTGLFERLNATDDELAAVLGHEIAHALREHGRERASQQMAQGVAIGILGAAAGLGEAGVDLAQLVANVTYGLPNSREFEREADRIGVELAARAGFDPRAAVSLWRKMTRTGGARPPQFLSTHPSDDSRIRELQGYAARVMPLYESARRR